MLIYPSLPCPLYNAKAKKIDDIRTEAQAELGIVDLAIPGLEALPGFQTKKAEEMELFPAFKGTDGWAGGRESAGEGIFR
jgi:hypothetical protein